MTEFDNNLRGVLFKNDKEGNEKRPDYTGNCEISGQKYQLSAWIKTSKAGTKFMSLSFQVDKPKAKEPELTPAFDDEIPF